MKITTQLTIQERSPAFYVLEVWTKHRATQGKLTSMEFQYIGDQPQPKGWWARLLRLKSTEAPCFRVTFAKQRNLALLATLDWFKSEGIPVPCAIYNVKNGTNILVGNYTICSAKDGRGQVLKSYAHHPDWASGKIKSVC